MKPFTTLATTGAILFSLLAPAAHAGTTKAKEVTLFDLYSRYVKAGRSVSALPEFGDDKEVLVSGIVLDHQTSFSGDSTMSAGDPRSDDELARLGAFDEAEDKKMDAIPVGAKFKAVCTIDYATMPALSLSNCVFKR
jgi:hypothetical protein